MVGPAENGQAAAPALSPAELAPAVEAVLFASPDPVPAATLQSVLGDGVTPELVREAIALLEEHYGAPGRGVRLVEVAGGWQLLTRDAYFPFVQRVARTRTEERLSPATIETLAVVAYKQPVTRAEVDAIRGAASGPILRTLMDKSLVRIVGRAELPGHPFQYGTTRRFLKHFGLRTARDLPDPKELGRILAEQGR